MINLRRLFLTVSPANVRQRFVAVTGSDANPGTEAQPFASINRALQLSNPGDRILVSPGTYGYTAINGNKGAPGKWIVVLPKNPTDVVNISITTTTDNFFEAIDTRYVAFFGLNVFGNQNNSNTNGSGFSVYGNSYGVRMWACTIHDFPGGGINCFDVNGSHDMLDFSFNHIYKTSRYSPSNTSGISIYASRDLNNGRVWRSGHGVRIVGNYIHDIVCTVPFTPGGYNIVTDGNGISLDLTYDTYGYVKPMLVEGNLLMGNGARGVHAYGTVNVDMFFNTAIGNMRNPTNSPAIAGDMELDSEVGYIKTQTTAQALSHRIWGNIIFPTNTPSWRDSRSDYQRNIILGGTQQVDGTNLDRKSLAWGYFNNMGPGKEITEMDPFAWVPKVPDLIQASQNSYPGFQAMGYGPRQAKQAWAAGALELPRTLQYVS